MIKKKELIILISILITAIIGIICVKIYQGSEAAVYVQITCDGSVLYHIPLEEDRTLHIETSYGYNDVIIKDGEVYIEDADCPDLICVHQGKISNLGISIICLPHILSIQLVNH